LPAAVVEDEMVVVWPARRQRNFFPRILISDKATRTFYFFDSMKFLEAHTDA
jgi:hypothetical protein